MVLEHYSTEAEFTTTIPRVKCIPGKGESALGREGADDKGTFYPGNCNGEFGLRTRNLSMFVETHYAERMCELVCAPVMFRENWKMELFESGTYNSYAMLCYCMDLAGKYERKWYTYNNTNNLRSIVFLSVISLGKTN